MALSTGSVIIALMLGALVFGVAGMAMDWLYGEGGVTTRILLHLASMCLGGAVALMLWGS